MQRIFTYKMEGMKEYNYWERPRILDIFIGGPQRKIPNYLHMEDGAWAANVAS